MGLSGEERQYEDYFINWAAGASPDYYQQQKRTTKMGYINMALADGYIETIVSGEYVTPARKSRKGASSGKPSSPSGAAFPKPFIATTRRLKWWCCKPRLVETNKLPGIGARIADDGAAGFPRAGGGDGDERGIARIGNRIAGAPNLGGGPKPTGARGSTRCSPSRVSPPDNMCPPRLLGTIYGIFAQYGTRLI